MRFLRAAALGGLILTATAGLGFAQDAASTCGQAVAGPDLVFQTSDATLEIANGDIAVVVQTFSSDARPGLGLALCPDAAQRLAEMTRSAIGQTMKLLIAEHVLLEATLVEPIADGRLFVSGDYTVEQVEALVAEIRPSAD